MNFITQKLLLSQFTTSHVTNFFTTMLLLIRTRANIGILPDKRCSFSRPMHPDIKRLTNPPRLSFSKYFFSYPFTIGYKELYDLKSTNINTVHYGEALLRFLLIVLQLREAEFKISADTVKLTCITEQPIAAGTSTLLMGVKDPFFKYTLSNKNPSAWNFLSPEPEVTCRTVAIKIRVVLLSPYLRIRGVSLSSIH